MTKLAWAALALSSLVSGEALAGPAPVQGPRGPGNTDTVPPPRKSAGCDRYTVGVGPYTGWSFGDDQFLLGASAQLGHSCVRWLRLEPHVGVGVGGNWGTWRFGARARVTLFLGESDRYGLTLLGGYSGLRSFPLGRFATFCKRTDLDQCWNTSTGNELGVAFEYWDFALSAIVGFEGLPDLGLTLSYAFPVRPATQRQP